MGKNTVGRSEASTAQSGPKYGDLLPTGYSSWAWIAGDRDPGR